MAEVELLQEVRLVCPRCRTENILRARQREAVERLGTLVGINHDGDCTGCGARLRLLTSWREGEERG